MNAIGYLKISDLYLLKDLIIINATMSEMHVIENEAIEEKIKVSCLTPTKNCLSFKECCYFSFSSTRKAG